METFSLLTFVGGALVGMGLLMLIVVLAMVLWSKYADPRE